MTNVKSPYNFVPAPREQEVFKPDWANHVSHDIPFEDGESGEIEITLEAKTPIFIRNGHAQGAETAEFSHYVDSQDKKQYFIPATSIKGMVRNVLEIMSCSRLNKNLVNNHRYAYRDLSKDSLYLKKYKTNDVYCGWLSKQENGSWLIVSCGKPDKITHREIDKELKTKFERKFKYQDRKKLTNEEKNAYYKYETLLKEEERHPIIEGEKLVCTGQASLRKEKSGKYNEFLFGDENGNSYELTEQQVSDFKFIYLDHDSNNISPDWKYWRGKLNNGEEIPIFFSKQGNKVAHFGLAYMYKLPFKKSIHETIPFSTYNNKDLDLAETMFGVSTDEKELKGRVYFSHAKCIGTPTVMDKQAVILASPKASFYPFYLNQPSNGKPYKTYEDHDAEVRGFKKYPVQDFKAKNNTAEDNRNDKIKSYIKPLAEGAKFAFKVRFHNLKKIEIGALLSALTFHSNNNRCYHAIGAAKPLGYGKVQLQIESKSKVNHELNDYMYAFEQAICTVKPDWLSTTINELDAITSLSHESLVYTLKPKDFANYKGKKDVLGKYSELVKSNRKAFIKSLEPKDLSSYDFSTYERFEDLSKCINQELDKEVPSELIEDVVVAIKSIYGNHKLSKRRLSKKDFSKEHWWKNNIAAWLGEQKAKQLYTELTGKDAK